MIVWVSDVSLGKGQGRPKSQATLMISPKVRPKILLVEFGILGFGTRNLANDWNPLEIQNPRLSWITLYGAIKYIKNI